MNPNETTLLMKKEIIRLGKDMLKESNLFDDLLMKLCFERFPSVIELILKTVLEEDIRFREIIPQKDLPNLFNRSATLDALAIDEESRNYVLELQRRNEGASIFRARYNGALCLVWMTEKGTVSNELDAFCTVIFITEKDVLKNHRPKTVIRMHDEESGLPMDDHTRYIFVNGENTDNTPLGLLMQDLHQTDWRKVHYPEIREALQYFKETEGEEENEMSAFNDAAINEWVERASPILEKRLEPVMRMIAEERAKVMVEERAKVMVEERAKVMVEERAKAMVEESAKAMVEERAKAMVEERAKAMAEKKTKELENRSLVRIRNLMQGLKISSDDALRYLGIQDANEIAYYKKELTSNLVS